MAGSAGTATTVPADTGDEFEDDDEGAKGGDGDGKKDDDDERVQIKDGKILVDGEEFDAERALDTITHQRESEKGLKKQLREVKAQVAELTKKGKPADEQVQAERDELKSTVTDLTNKLNKQTVRNLAMEVATSLKFKNPAIAHKLIDSDEIEWDDDEPTNIEQLLKAEAKGNPYLIRRGRATTGDEEVDDDGADGGKGRGSRTGSGSDMNTNIRGMAGH